MVVSTADKIIVPQEAVSVCLMIRHSITMSGWHIPSRVLTKEGVELCSQVQPAYEELDQVLASQFGRECTVMSSPVPATIMTATLMTNATEIFPQASLEATVHETFAQRGYKDWSEERLNEGRTETELIRLALLNSEMRYRLVDCREEEYGITRLTCSGYMWGVCPQAKVHKLFVHEPTTSFWAVRRSLPHTEAGLEFLQSYVLFRDNRNQLVGQIQKFTPPATMRPIA